MLGTVMFCSKILMEVLPNIHLLGMLTMSYTLAFRKKALIPIYIYVLLNGLYGGFSLWWFPYLYIWTLLWGMIMLLPRRMPTWLAAMIYAAVCGLHGFAFGFLWIPSQMLLMGFSFEQALVWWKFGFITADIPHGIGNLVGSTLIIPLVTLIRKLDKRAKT
jgi:energy-coupling factor transport system substrate-specific component